jgi:hypothetical protein
MKTVGLIALILSITTANHGPAGRAPERNPGDPTSPAPAPARSSINQLPFLFIVDGVRYSGDQVPLLSAELVASVKVVKGRRALEQYGPDASYGVVIITTKVASSRRS